MENSRHGLRAKCGDKCILILNGSAYECLLEDISISGALVQISETIADIRPGSSCGLHLCRDPQICPGKYACRVTRITPKEIGLSFINMN